MSDQEWSEPPGPHPPPAALPDGSIPTYSSHDGPAQPRVGWGPLPRRRRPSGLLVGLLLLGGVAAFVVTVALALRESDSSAATPQPGAGQAAPVGTRDDSAAGAPQSQAATRTVTADALYATGPQRTVGCRQAPVPLSKQKNVQAYYSNVVACLSKAWAPQIQAAKDTFAPPRLLFWSGVVQSPCATGASVSFYCGVSQTLYLKSSDDIKLWSRSADAANRAFTRMWATYTAGHEYAHHVQQLTGILPAARQLEYDAPDQDARLELSRRLELQASCLSAVFTGANKSSYGITGLDLTIYQNYVLAKTGDENNRGGPRDHGARASHLYWTGRGFSSLDSVSCNTFTATAGKVL